MSRLRIGTYNVQGLRGFPSETAHSVLGDSETAAAATCFEQAIRELGCDLLVLQEGASFFQMKRLADGLQQRLAMLPSPCVWPGYVLSSYQVLESEILMGKTPSGKVLFSRMAGVVTVHIPERFHLSVLALHLHPEDAQIRTAEISEILLKATQLLAVSEHLVVLGDFNCEPSDTIHTSLNDLGFLNVIEACGQAERTYGPVGSGLWAIDHIYVSASLRPMLLSARVIKEHRFYSALPLQNSDWLYSDHLPVVADFALDQKTGY